MKVIFDNMAKKGKRARQKARAEAKANAPTQTVIIMRGPSGSGKTTSANLICNTSKEKGLSSAIHSTDTFFLDNLGNYVFDPKMLQEYHSKNRDAFQQSLKDGVNIVIVDNTNLLKEKYSQYWSLSRKFKYEVIEKMPETKWLFDAEDCHYHCTKDVPLYAIERQISQFEPF